MNDHMNTELAELAELLRRVALEYDARARDAGPNECNRTAYMAMAADARRREAFVRELLAERRSGWITHEEASSPDDRYDD